MVFLQNIELSPSENHAFVSFVGFSDDGKRIEFDPIKVSTDPAVTSLDDVEREARKILLVRLKYFVSHLQADLEEASG